jgi:Protein of unknown function (DUF1203)
MTITFTAIPTATVRALQSGGADAYGLIPERKHSDGGGNPCRHCLQMIPQGAGMLVLAHRPFPALQPYAETGPIFLCADPCAQGGGAEMPAILASPDYILRGYGADDRIVYGSGAVVPTTALADRAKQLFEDTAIAYLHVRSARNNCYQLRIDRAAP